MDVQSVGLKMQKQMYVFGTCPMISGCPCCNRVFTYNDISFFIEIRNSYETDSAKAIKKYGYPQIAPMGARPGTEKERYAAGSGDAFALDHIGFDSECCRNYCITYFR